MQTDIEDAMAQEWQGAILDELAFFVGQQSALEGPASLAMTTRYPDGLDQVLALRRCRQAISRCLSLHRLLTIAPYQTREALDWGEAHRDDAPQFKLIA